MILIPRLRRGQDLNGGPDGLLNARDVDPSAVEHTALGAEVVLHIHDDNGGRCGI
jgi:hypothetical protein